jgi:aryl-alcohol dehydrogenase-like predicted oxidoreductase
MKEVVNSLSLHGVGLGTFPFSNVFGKVSADEATEITKYYLDHGTGYIQASPYYKDVEPLLGKILADVPRGSYKLATLCVKDKDSQLSGKHDAILAQCNDSLTRLGLEYIDLLMTSTPEAKDAPFSETIEAMQKLKRQGKIRAIGVCNVTLEQLKEYNTTGAVQYVQNRLSLIDQEADRDVREYCVKHGIGLIPYNVIEWGLLTDKMLHEWTLREGDLRTKVLPVFEESQKHLLHEWIQEDLKPIADEYQTTIEGLAISWVLGQPGVATCPVGATTVSQIAASLACLESSSNAELVNELNRAYENLVTKVQSAHRMELNAFLKNSYGRW